MHNKPLQRKAQLSLMMIFGITILLIFFVLFYYLSTQTPSKRDFSDTQEISDFITECLTTTAERGLIELGKKGGRIYPGDLATLPIQERSYSVVYGLKGSVMLLPSIEDMELDLKRHAESTLDECINDFSEAKGQGWRVEASAYAITSSINLDDVSYSMSYPLTLEKAGERSSLEQFSMSLPIRLNYLHSSASDLLTFAEQNEYGLSRTLINSFTFNTTMLPYQGSLVVQFLDSTSSIDEKPYAFQFAIDDE